jgi:hypothetical protein
LVPAGRNGQKRNIHAGTANMSAETEKVELIGPLVVSMDGKDAKGTAPQLQGKCRAECRGPPPEAAECRAFAAECRDFGRRASDFFGFCAEAARLVLKLRAGARRAVRPSAALGGRIKRATNTRHRGSQREGQKKAGKANLIYMACAAPVV